MHSGKDLPHGGVEAEDRNYSSLYRGTYHEGDTSPLLGQFGTDEVEREKENTWEKKRSPLQEHRNTRGLLWRTPTCTATISERASHVTRGKDEEQQRIEERDVTVSPCQETSAVRPLPEPFLKELRNKSKREDLMKLLPHKKLGRRGEAGSTCTDNRKTNKNPGGSFPGENFSSSPRLSTSSPRRASQPSATSHGSGPRRRLQERPVLSRQQASCRSSLCSLWTSGLQAPSASPRTLRPSTRIASPSDFNLARRSRSQSCPKMSYGCPSVRAPRPASASAPVSSPAAHSSFHTLPCHPYVASFPLPYCSSGAVSSISNSSFSCSRKLSPGGPSSASSSIARFPLVSYPAWTTEIEASSSCSVLFRSPCPLLASPPPEALDAFAPLLSSDTALNPDSLTAPGAHEGSLPHVCQPTSCTPLSPPHPTSSRSPCSDPRSFSDSPVQLQRSFSFPSARVFTPILRPPCLSPCASFLSSSSLSSHSVFPPAFLSHCYTAPPSTAVVSPAAESFASPPSFASIPSGVAPAASAVSPPPWLSTFPVSVGRELDEQLCGLSSYCQSRTGVATACTSLGSSVFFSPASSSPLFVTPRSVATDTETQQDSLTEDCENIDPFFPAFSSSSTLLPLCFRSSSALSSCSSCFSPLYSSSQALPRGGYISLPCPSKNQCCTSFPFASKVPGRSSPLTAGAAFSPPPSLEALLEQPSLSGINPYNVSGVDSPDIIIEDTREEEQQTTFSPRRTGTSVENDFPSILAEAPNKEESIGININQGICMDLEKQRQDHETREVLDTLGCALSSDENGFTGPRVTTEDGDVKKTNTGQREHHRLNGEEGERKEESDDTSNVRHHSFNRRSADKQKRGLYGIRQGGKLNFSQTHTSLTSYLDGVLSPSVEALRVERDSEKRDGTGISKRKGHGGLDSPHQEDCRTVTMRSHEDAKSSAREEVKHERREEGKKRTVDSNLEDHSNKEASSLVGEKDKSEREKRLKHQDHRHHCKVDGADHRVKSGKDKEEDFEGHPHETGHHRQGSEESLISTLGDCLRVCSLADAVAGASESGGSLSLTREPSKIDDNEEEEERRVATKKGDTNNDMGERKREGETGVRKDQEDEERTVIEGGEEKEGQLRDQIEERKEENREKKWRRLVLCLFLFIQGTVNIDNGIVPAVLGDLGREFDATAAEQGLLGALPHVGMLVFCPFCARLLEFARPKRLLFLSLSLNICAMLLFAQSKGRFFLFLSRFLIGFSQTAFVVYAPVWADKFAPHNLLTLWMGLVQAAVVFGVVVGYLLAGFLRRGHCDWRVAVFLQMGLLLFLNLLVAVTKNSLIDVWDTGGGLGGRQESFTGIMLEDRGEEDEEGNEDLDKENGDETGVGDCFVGEARKETKRGMRRRGLVKGRVSGKAQPAITYDEDAERKTNLEGDEENTRALGDKQDDSDACESLADTQKEKGIERERQSGLAKEETIELDGQKKEGKVDFGKQFETLPPHPSSSPSPLYDSTALYASGFPYPQRQFHELSRKSHLDNRNTMIQQPTTNCFPSLSSSPCLSSPGLSRPTTASPPLESPPPAKRRMSPSPTSLVEPKSGSDDQLGSTPITQLISQERHVASLGLPCSSASSILSLSSTHLKDPYPFVRSSPHQGQVQNRETSPPSDAIQPLTSVHSANDEMLSSQRRTVVAVSLESGSAPPGEPLVPSSLQVGVHGLSTAAVPSSPSIVDNCSSFLLFSSSSSTNPRSDAIAKVSETDARNVGRIAHSAVSPSSPSSSEVKPISTEVPLTALGAPLVMPSSETHGGHSVPTVPKTAPPPERVSPNHRPFPPFTEVQSPQLVLSVVSSPSRCRPCLASNPQPSPLLQPSSFPLSSSLPSLAPAPPSGVGDITGRQDRHLPAEPSEQSNLIEAQTALPAFCSPALPPFSQSGSLVSHAFIPPRQAAPSLVDSASGQTVRRSSLLGATNVLHNPVVVTAVDAPVLSPIHPTEVCPQGLPELSSSSVQSSSPSSPRAFVYLDNNSSAYTSEKTGGPEKLSHSPAPPLPPKARPSSVVILSRPRPSESSSSPTIQKSRFSSVRPASTTGFHLSSRFASGGAGGGRFGWGGGSRSTCGSGAEAEAAAAAAIQRRWKQRQLILSSISHAYMCGDDWVWGVSERERREKKELKRDRRSSEITKRPSRRREAMTTEGRETDTGPPQERTKEDLKTSPESTGRDMMERNIGPVPEREMNPERKRHEANKRSEGTIKDENPETAERKSGLKISSPNEVENEKGEGGGSAMVTSVTPERETLQGKRRGFSFNFRSREKIKQHTGEVGEQEMMELQGRKKERHRKIHSFSSAVEAGSRPKKQEGDHHAFASQLLPSKLPSMTSSSHCPKPRSFSDVGEERPSVFSPQGGRPSSFFTKRPAFFFQGKLSSAYLHHHGDHAPTSLQQHVAVVQTGLQPPPNSADAGASLSYSTEKKGTVYTSRANTGEDDTLPCFPSPPPLPLPPTAAVLTVHPRKKKESLRSFHSRENTEGRRQGTSKTGRGGGGAGAGGGSHVISEAWIRGGRLLQFSPPVGLIVSAGLDSGSPPVLLTGSGAEIGKKAGGAGGEQLHVVAATAAALVVAKKKSERRRRRASEERGLSRAGTAPAKTAGGAGPMEDRRTRLQKGEGYKVMKGSSMERDENQQERWSQEEVKGEKQEKKKTLKRKGTTTSCPRKEKDDPANECPVLLLESGEIPEQEARQAEDGRGFVERSEEEEEKERQDTEGRDADEKLAGRRKKGREGDTKENPLLLGKEVEKKRTRAEQNTLCLQSSSYLKREKTGEMFRGKREEGKTQGRSNRQGEDNLNGEHEAREHRDIEAGEEGQAEESRCHDTREKKSSAGGFNIHHLNEGDANAGYLSPQLLDEGRTREEKHRDDRDSWGEDLGAVDEKKEEIRRREEWRRHGGWGWRLLSRWRAGERRRRRDEGESSSKRGDEGENEQGKRYRDLGKRDGHDTNNSMEEGRPSKESETSSQQQNSFSASFASSSSVDLTPPRHRREEEVRRKEKPHLHQRDLKEDRNGDGVNLSCSFIPKPQFPLLRIKRLQQQGAEDRRRGKRRDEYIVQTEDTSPPGSSPEKRLPDEKPSPGKSSPARLANRSISFPLTANKERIATALEENVMAVPSQDSLDEAIVDGEGSVRCGRQPNEQPKGTSERAAIDSSVEKEVEEGARQGEKEVVRKGTEGEGELLEEHGVEEVIPSAVVVSAAIRTSPSPMSDHPVFRSTPEGILENPLYESTQGIIASSLLLPLSKETATPEEMNVPDICKVAQETVDLLHEEAEKQPVPPNSSPISGAVLSTVLLLPPDSPSNVSSSCPSSSFEKETSSIHEQPLSAPLPADKNKSKLPIHSSLEQQVSVEEVRKARSPTTAPDGLPLHSEKQDTSLPPVHSSLVENVSSSTPDQEDVHDDGVVVASLVCLPSPLGEEEVHIKEEVHIPVSLIGEDEVEVSNSIEQAPSSLILVTVEEPLDAREERTCDSSPSSSRSSHAETLERGRDGEGYMSAVYQDEMPLSAKNRKTGGEMNLVSEDEPLLESPEMTHVSVVLGHSLTKDENGNQNDTSCWLSPKKPVRSKSDTAQYSSYSSSYNLPHGSSIPSSSSLPVLPQTSPVLSLSAPLVLKATERPRDNVRKPLHDPENPDELRSPPVAVTEGRLDDQSDHPLGEIRIPPTTVKALVPLHTVSSENKQGDPKSKEQEQISLTSLVQSSRTDPHSISSSAKEESEDQEKSYPTVLTVQVTEKDDEVESVNTPQSRVGSPGKRMPLLFPHECKPDSSGQEKENHSSTALIEVHVADGEYIHTTTPHRSSLRLGSHHLLSENIQGHPEYKPTYIKEERPSVRVPSAAFILPPGQVSHAQSKKETDGRARGTKASIEVNSSDHQVVTIGGSATVEERGVPNASVSVLRTKQSAEVPEEEDDEAREPPQPHRQEDKRAEYKKERKTDTATLGEEKERGEPQGTGRTLGEKEPTLRSKSGNIEREGRAGVHGSHEEKLKSAEETREREEQEEQETNALSCTSSEEDSEEGSEEIRERRPLFRLLKNPTYMALTLALCALFFEVTAIQFWATRFFEEELHTDTATVLISFSATAATAPAAGIVIGALVVDWLGGYRYGGERQRLKALLYLLVLSSGCVVLGFFAAFSNTFWIAISLIWLILFLGGGILPTASGMILAVVDSDSKAKASGLATFLYTLLGYTAGTFVPGLLNDSLGTRGGMQMVLLWSIFGFLLVLLATAVRWRLVKQEDMEDQEEEDEDEENEDEEEEEDKESFGNDDCEDKNSDREWNYVLEMNKSKERRQGLTANDPSENFQGAVKKDTGVEKIKQDQLVPDTIPTRASTAAPTPRLFETSTSS